MRALEAYVPEIEAQLARVPGAGHPLAEPMAYALQGGKRLRPGLLLACAAACGADWRAFTDAAAGVECIHAYSLVHDDLPAMDDDDLRRGRPTVHRAFGEATAILVGDGLLTVAFGLLAGRPGEPHPDRRLQAIREVAEGAGVGPGMVGGQALDLIGAEDAEGARRVGAAKTGHPMGGASAAGATLSGAQPRIVSALRTFGRALGSAFQIRDDLLDVLGSADAVGKRTQKDAAKRRPNFARLVGIEAAQSELVRASEAARQELRAARELGCEVDQLLQLVDELFARER